MPAVLTGPRSLRTLALLFALLMTTPAMAQQGDDKPADKAEGAKAEESPSAKRAREEREAAEKAKKDKDGDKEEGEEGEGEAEESPSAKRAREEAEAKAKKEAEAKAKAEAEAKAKAEAEAKAKAEAEAKAKAEEEAAAKKKMAEEQAAAEAAAKEEEERIKWLPGWGLGVNATWLFTDLEELEETVLVPNEIPGFDTPGLVRYEFYFTQYITPKFQTTGLFGGLVAPAGDTSHSFIYGGIEPALVFPEHRVEFILGLKLMMGAYSFEGTPEGGEARGYSGLAMGVEPNFGVRWVASKEIMVDFRAGVQQFIALNSNEDGDAIELGSAPGQASGDNVLDYAAPTFTIGVMWGEAPKRPKKEEPKEEEGEKEGEPESQPASEPESAPASEPAAVEGESPSAKRAREEREAAEKAAAEKKAEEDKAPAEGEGDEEEKDEDESEEDDKKVESPSAKRAREEREAAEKKKAAEEGGDEDAPEEKGADE
jgi:hypothetical protein